MRVPPSVSTHTHMCMHAHACECAHMHVFEDTHGLICASRNVCVSTAMSMFACKRGNAKLRKCNHASNDSRKSKAFAMFYCCSGVSRAVSVRVCVCVRGCVCVCFWCSARLFFFVFRRLVFFFCCYSCVLRFSARLRTVAQRRRAKSKWTGIKAHTDTPKRHANMAANNKNLRPTRMPSCHASRHASSNNKQTAASRSSSTSTSSSKKRQQSSSSRQQQQQQQQQAAAAAARRSSRRRSSSSSSSLNQDANMSRRASAQTRHISKHEIANMPCQQPCHTNMHMRNACDANKNANEHANVPCEPSCKPTCESECNYPNKNIMQAHAMQGNMPHQHASTPHKQTCPTNVQNMLRKQTRKVNMRMSHANNR